MKNQFTTFFVVDDHPLMRDALRVSIENSSEKFSFAGEAGDFEAACQSILSLNVNLIVLDHSLRTHTGLDLIKRLRELRPGIKYLLVTQCEDPAVLAQYQDLKIAGMVSKLNSNTEMKIALEHLAENKPYICSSIKSILETPRPTSGLTQREIDIIKLMAQGKSNKEVANALHCSDQTIKTHKANIMRKLNLSNSVEVSVWAIKNRLL